MKKRLGEFTLDEIYTECDRHETCFDCPVGKSGVSCMANPRWRKYFDMEIEIADIKEEK